MAAKTGNEHADYKIIPLVLATPYNAECFTQKFSFPIPFLFNLWTNVLVYVLVRCCVRSDNRSVCVHTS